MEKRFRLTPRSGYCETLGRTKGAPPSAARRWLLLRGVAQIGAGFLKAQAVVVEAVDDVVELAHLGARQFRHDTAIGVGLEVNAWAGPA